MSIHGRGCRHCVEYGRLLDQAKLMRLEDGKGYRNEIAELRQQIETLEKERDEAIAEAKIFCEDADRYSDANDSLQEDNDRLMEHLGMIVENSKDQGAVDCANEALKQD